MGIPRNGRTRPRGFQEGIRVSQGNHSRGSSPQGQAARWHGRSPSCQERVLVNERSFLPSSVRLLARRSLRKEADVRQPGGQDRVEVTAFTESPAEGLSPVITEDDDVTEPQTQPLPPSRATPIVVPSSPRTTAPG